MPENEIIKALENCGNKGECNKCPLKNLGNGISLCIPHLTQSALDLINRQKAEIDILIRKKEALRDEIAEQQAEIERLREKIKSLYKELERIALMTVERDIKEKK